MVKHVTVIKLTVVVICHLLTSTIFLVITLYNWNAFLVFRREEISYDQYSAK